MVIITPKGNPLGIGKGVDLAEPDVKLIRVTGEKDLATGRTIEFIRRATELEGRAELAQKIVDSAVVEPGAAATVPGVVTAVKQGRARGPGMALPRACATTARRCAGGRRFERLRWRSTHRR